MTINVRVIFGWIARFPFLQNTLALLEVCYCAPALGRCAYLRRTNRCPLADSM
jgi:hypothetical protein